MAVVEVNKINYKYDGTLDVLTYTHPFMMVTAIPRSLFSPVALRNQAVLTRGLLLVSHAMFRGTLRDQYYW